MRRIGILLALLSTSAAQASAWRCQAENWTIWRLRNEGGPSAELTYIAPTLGGEGSLLLALPETGSSTMHWHHQSLTAEEVGAPRLCERTEASDQEIRELRASWEAVRELVLHSWQPTDRPRCLDTLASLLGTTPVISLQATIDPITWSLSAEWISWDHERWPRRRVLAGHCERVEARTVPTEVEEAVRKKFSALERFGQFRLAILSTLGWLEHHHRRFEDERRRTVAEADRIGSAQLRAVALGSYLEFKERSSRQAWTRIESLRQQWIGGSPIGPPLAAPASDDEGLDGPP